MTASMAGVPGALAASAASMVWSSVKPSTYTNDVWIHPIQVAPRQVLQPGTHTFYFSGSIPTDLPAPFSYQSPGSHSCSISYTVAAHVKTSAFLSVIASEPVNFFPTQPPIDIRNIPPLETSRSMTFLFGATGETATVTLRSARSTYNSGDDTAHFLMWAKNHSARDMVELRFQLIQTIVIEARKAMLSQPQPKKIFKRVISRFSFPGVKAGESGHKVLRLEVPAAAPTLAVPGLTIQYSAEIIGVMGYSISNVTASAPIVIIASGRGMLVSARTSKEEDDLVAASAASGTVIPYHPRDSDVGVGGGSSSQSLQDGDGNILDGAALPLTVAEALKIGVTLSNGATELILDCFQSGTVSFQQSNLWYFDVETDVQMIGSDEAAADEDGDDLLAGAGEEKPPPFTGSRPFRATGLATPAGMPSVIVASEDDVGLRISKDVIPSWWSYHLRDECRSQKVDGSQESLARLSLGPGRYYISVIGNSLSSAAGVRYRIRVTPLQGGASTSPAATRQGEGPDFEGLDDGARDYWVRAKGNIMPPDAWEVGTDCDGTPLYAARAWMGGGMHIGKCGQHLQTANIPYGGGEKPVDGDFEVLTRIPNARWERQLGSGVPPNAIPAGHEADGRPLYIGRGVVKKGFFKSSLCPGKCAPHIKGLNVPFDGKEYFVSPFEVLVYDERIPVQPIPTSFVEQLFDENTDERRDENAEASPRLDWEEL
ncbi:hypothetical protein HK101_006724 [Irineochytrium annulatum]|nr:hypothetical protein HK101_006724 [Irineochytrium annulatum]